MQIYNDYCTGCGLCSTVCPRGCISLVIDKLGNRKPIIDESKCIHCDKCKNYCPQNNFVISNDIPRRVYVGWNNDAQVRTKGASGGIASAIYKYCLENNIHTFGVRLDSNFIASYIEINTDVDIELCRNSKYVFSDFLTVIDKIKTYIDNGEKVLFIGLPCQVAAVKMLCNKHTENLIAIDLVCHGSCSNEYLIQYINFISHKYKFRTSGITFRNPIFGTNNYVLSFYEGDNLKYKRKVHSDDLYQMAYHYSLDYRDSCYHCHYAKPERVGDITLSDFSGIGIIAEFNEDKKSISCIIISSDKGDAFIRELYNIGLICIQDRPIDEALKFEPKLKNPPKMHPKREVFIDSYRETGDFIKAAQRALRRDLFLNTFKVRKIKQVARKILKG